MIPRSVHVEAHTFHVCVVQYGGLELIGLAAEYLGHLFMAKANILLVHERPAPGTICDGVALDEGMISDEMRRDAGVPANHAALEDVPARRPVFEVRGAFQFLIDKDSAMSDR